MENQVKYVNPGEFRIVRYKANEEYSLDRVEKCVCMYYNLDARALRKKTHQEKVVKARRLFYVICREMSIEKRLQWLAAHLDQNHTTVLHAIKTFNNITFIEERSKRYNLLADFKNVVSIIKNRKEDGSGCN